MSEKQPSNLAQVTKAYNNLLNENRELKEEITELKNTIATIIELAIKIAEAPKELDNRLSIIENLKEIGAKYNVCFRT